MVSIAFSDSSVFVWFTISSTKNDEAASYGQLFYYGTSFRVLGLIMISYAAV